MGYHDDTTMYNWLALYVAIIWYAQITPEQAFRIVENRSNMKKMCRIVTPELAAKIRKICSSPCFWNMDRLCKRFGVDKETVHEILRGN
jgi:hypothetical protein